MYWWKLVLPVLVIELFAAWYPFRPDRLAVNRRVNEGFPVAQAGLSPQVFEPGTFYGVFTPPRARQQSTVLGMEIAFSGSRVSGPRTALMFTYTWSLLTMQKTTRRWSALASSIWEALREISVTRIAH